MTLEGEEHFGVVEELKDRPGARSNVLLDDK